MEATHARAVVTEGTDADAHLRLSRTELLLIFAFWTFVAVLTAASALLDPRRRGLQPAVVSAPVALAFAEYYLWAAVTPVVFLLAGRLRPERTRWLNRALLLLGAGILTAVVIDAVTTYLRFEVFFIPRRRPPPSLSPWFAISRLWFLDDLFVYFAVLSAAFARDSFLRLRTRQEETVRLQAHAAQLQAQLAEARLSALRTQLDPHFLFNTLHAVSALVERDPRGVRRMISRLSELLRYSLEGAQAQEVPLAQEWKFVQRYLEIMEIRFQGRLDLSLEMDPTVADALVPSLVLQPLVENAIKHGVEKIEGTGRIRIEAAREGGAVVLRVRDNGPAAPAGAVEGAEGVGLRNTRARLEQLYGAGQRLALAPAEGGGMVAEVRLPYHTGADVVRSV